MYTEKNNTIAAIVSEYNPFHNGHKYHIEETRRITGCDYIISLMSGNYVQRGLPALVDKYYRTMMALNNGVDLVIELPVTFALSSAEFFAKGAINILNNMNCVDYLSFGSESGQLSSLKQLADILSRESPKTNDKLKTELKKGMNYPKALSESLSGIDKDLLSMPNNILSVEYLKALIQTNSNIEGITIKRKDNGYNSSELNEHSSLSSATSIRNTILNGSESSKNRLKDYLPGDCNEMINQTPFVSLNDFSELLYYKLLTEKAIGYEKYLDVNEELSYKILKNIKDYKSFEDFSDKLKSKNMTHARIHRALFHILLNIYNEDILLAPDYIRILGFRDKSSDLLNIIKNRSDIPMITKLSDAPSLPLLEKDIFAADLYQFVTDSHRNEYRQSPIIIR